jgi:hypothetical protein
VAIPVSALIRTKGAAVSVATASNRPSMGLVSLKLLGMRTTHVAAIRIFDCIENLPWYIRIGTHTPG